MAPINNRKPSSRLSGDRNRGYKKNPKSLSKKEFPKNRLRNKPKASSSPPPEEMPFQAIKEMLFKSKGVDSLSKPKEGQEANHESIKPTELDIAENSSNPPISSPVFLKEKKTWRNQKLSESSLLHLLVLETLYIRCFYNDFLPPQKPFNCDSEKIFEWLQENHAFLKQDISNLLKPQVIEYVGAIEEIQEKTITEISVFLIGWDWNRLPLVRQSILIAAWHLIKVSPSSKILELLNDAINHAKWFGDEKDYAFVNSVLDKLITDKQLWP